MARPKVEELHKHTLNLRAGDMQALEELFPNLPPSIMARKIISRFIDKTRSVTEVTLPTPDLDI